jgi:hypothetical protein
VRGPGAAILLALAVARGAAGAEEPMRRLAGTVPPVLATLEVLGPAAADMPLDAVTVVLGLRDRRHLEALLAAQQDPHTPDFHRWLDLTQLADRFGPRRVDYERVRGWFTARGFRVVREVPSRVALVLGGTAGQVAAALATPIQLFRRGSRTYHGPATDPALPESVAVGVRGIFGLDDLPHFQPLARLAGGQVALEPSDLAVAYEAAPLRAAGITGAGYTIAVVARSNFHDSDVEAFAARFTQPPQIAFARRLVDEGSDPGVLPVKGEEVEVLLDTQWAGALAPGAQVNVVISPRGGDIPDSLSKAVHDREGDIITISFSLCESQAPVVGVELFDSLYALANAQGQTVLVASGDNGGTECAPANTTRAAVNALAASPHVVAVGGTSFPLATDGTIPLPPDERTWNDDLGAGGGGESVRFARPLYQLLAGPVVGKRRALPDLALAASPRTPGYFIVEGGVNRVIGGTSAGAPALASMLALVNERVGATGGLGQLVPALYRLGSEQARGLRAPVFRDVTLGDNAVQGGPGFAAGPGFDLATGWGTPLVGPLAAALGGPGRCEPELACLVPAPGPRRQACAAEWLVEHATAPGSRALPPASVVCRDGDPQCDADGSIDGQCTVNVGLCLNVLDTRPAMLDRQGFPACEPAGARGVTLVGPRGDASDPFARSNRAAFAAALDGLPTFSTTLRTACTTTVPLRVPVRPAGSRRTTRLRAQVARAGGNTSTRLRLRCTAS